MDATSSIHMHMPMHSDKVALAFDFGFNPLAGIPDSDFFNFDTLFSEPEEGSSAATNIPTGTSTSSTDPVELFLTTLSSTPELILPDSTPASAPTPPPNHFEDTHDDSPDSGRPTKRARLTRSSYRSGAFDNSALSSSSSSKAPHKSRPSTRSTRSRIATSPPPPKPITITGHVLQPTVVWDTFWRWCAERKSIYDRRQAGEPFPCVLVLVSLQYMYSRSLCFPFSCRWTEDVVLQQKFFCNTYRVLDKTSQYLIHHVIQKGSQDPIEIMFRVLLFDMFTKIQTWEYLESRIGSTSSSSLSSDGISTIGTLTWSTYDREKYDEALEARVKAGHTLYTGAFQKSAPRWEYVETWRNHLTLLESIMDTNPAERIQKAQSMSEAYAYLAGFPNMGPFNAYQLLLNLSYTPLLNFSGKDFVVPGPGAESGLKKMFGPDVVEEKMEENPGFCVEVIRWMMETQSEHFERLGLKFEGLGLEKRGMELADIEHAICEVDKYARMVHPLIENGSTHIRRKFVPPPSSSSSSPSLFERDADSVSTKPSPLSILPTAWSHPNRKIIRPCNTLPEVEQRYTVDKIISHDYRVRDWGDRDGSNHKSELHFCVRWYKYEPKDDTWEPAEELVKDALPAVNAYWEKKMGCRYMEERE